MNQITKIVITIITLLVIGTFFWYFANIIAYILIAFVFSMLGLPIVILLDKVHYKNIKIPKVISAGLALITLWGFGILILSLLIPILANEASNLSNINSELAISSFNEPIKQIEQMLIEMNIRGVDFGVIQSFISEKLVSIISISQLSTMFNFITKLLGNAVIGVFAITFITFFFLKDDKLFGKIILAFSPTEHERKVKRIMLSTRKLLVRYFLGLLVDVFIICTLVTTGMTIIGIDFQQAVVIGLFAGLLNVIPYVGPIIAIIFGISFYSISYIELNFIEQIMPILGYMLIVYIIVQIIDATLLQPYIYSNSVKAHPLEIFLVIISAGSLAGIAGMLLAIPTYTIIRVIAKEFFINFKVVKKLTENL